MFARSVADKAVPIAVFLLVCAFFQCLGCCCACGALFHRKYHDILPPPRRPTVDPAFKQFAYGRHAPEAAPAAGTTMAAARGRLRLRPADEDAPAEPDATTRFDGKWSVRPGEHTRME